MLFRETVLGINSLWEMGDHKKFPWLHEELNTIDSQRDQLEIGKIQERLELILQRFAAAKGVAPHQLRSCSMSVDETQGISHQVATTKTATFDSDMKERDEHMKFTISDGDFKRPPTGEYTVAVKEIGPLHASPFEGDKQQFALTLQVVDGEFKDVELKDFVTWYEKPGSSSKIVKIVRALYENAASGQSFDTDNWIGKQAKIFVEETTKQDGSAFSAVKAYYPFGKNGLNQSSENVVVL